MKTRIVSDSSVNLLSLQDVDFSTVPMKIIAGAQEFVDDGALDVPAMLHYLREHKGKSSTACPNVAEWIAAFGDAEQVFGAAITSTLSGCYSAGRIAAEHYMLSHPGSKVFILDSLSTGPELQLIVEKYRELVLQGLSFEQIRDEIIRYHQRTHLLFSLSSLTNFVRNGRVSPAVAAVAGILGIRIVGCASDVGDLKPLHKSRGEKRALACLLDCMAKTGYAGGKVRLYHTQNEAAAQKFAGMLRSRYPNSDVTIGANRGLCSYYAESGGLLVGFETP